MKKRLNNTSLLVGLVIGLVIGAVGFWFGTTLLNQAPGEIADIYQSTEAATATGTAYISKITAKVVRNFSTPSVKVVFIELTLKCKRKATTDTDTFFTRTVPVQLTGATEVGLAYAGANFTMDCGKRSNTNYNTIRPGFTLSYPKGGPYTAVFQLITDHGANLHGNDQKAVTFRAN